MRSEADVSDYVSTAALVLRAKDYKEADQLLTVYTKAKGKMTVLAKGVKKNSSKLRGGLQLFGQTALTLAVGKGIPVVINAESMDIFPAIRADLTRMSYAGYCAELLDRLLVSDECDEALFLLILQSMNLLAYIDPWIASKTLEIRLLDRLGYAPNLEYCQECGRELRHAQGRLGIAGGSLCLQCGEGLAHMQVTALGAEAVTLYRALKDMPLEQLGHLYVSKPASHELELYLDLQIDQVLDYPLKTRQFLRDLVNV